jgi:hypothetical protein
MAVELESVPDERAPEGKGNKAAEEGCPIEMGRERSKCRRPLNNAPEGLDEPPVCLMHSKDPNKAEGDYFEAFWREFEVILEDAGESEAHFEGFSFPELDLTGLRFKAICRFEGATFTQHANFGRATFTQDAKFGGATFTQDANFSYATFTKNANFSHATFTQDAYFFKATFTKDADFLHATFTQDAEFGQAIFTQDAKFGW